MSWEVEFTDEFEAWWNSLTGEEQWDVARSVNLLGAFGPTLDYPYSSQVQGSRFSHMRELRTQSGGRPLRTLYAFDPLRAAILLVDGDKTGDERWYEKYVPVADRIYEAHLEQLRREGKI